MHSSRKKITVLNVELYSENSCILTKIILKNAFSKSCSVKAFKYDQMETFFASKAKNCYRYGIYLQQVFDFDTKNAYLSLCLQDLTLQLKCKNDQNLVQLAVSKLANMATQRHILHQNKKNLFKVYTLPIPIFCF